MDNAVETEYAIIGGGIIGALTARALIARGVGVVLIEAEGISSGSSGGLGKRGFRSTGRAPAELPLAVASARLWKQYAEEISGGLPITWNGLVSLFGGSGEGWMNPAEVDDIIAAHAREGAHLERISTTEAAAAIGCEPVGVDFALHNPDDGIGDHTGVTEAVVRDAKAAGLTVLLHSKVTRIVSKNGYELHTGTGTIVRARRVLVASNAGTEGLLDRSFGASLPLSIAVPQYCFLRPARATRWERLVEHATLNFAAKLVPSGEIMLSGGGRGFLDEQGKPQVDHERINQNVARFIETFPSLSDATLGVADASRAEMFTPDGLPIIGSLAGIENLVVAAGWSGHGFMIAPAIAEAIATQLYSGIPQPELAPFSPARFE